MKELELYGDKIGKVQYISHMGDCKTIVNSARVSFGSDNEVPLNDRDIKLIKYLIEHRHTSVLEHNILTCKFVVPLFVRSQHHRHRTWSYNEISRRYTDKDLQFYCPELFRTQAETNRQASNLDGLIDPVVYQTDQRDGTIEFERASMLVKTHAKECLDLYEDLITAGVCREQARMVLPQNLYTEYYGTVNLNNLLRFIDLRKHEGAQWEIQVVAEALESIASELWPEVFEVYKEIKKNA